MRQFAQHKIISTSIALSLGALLTLAFAPFDYKLLGLLAVVGLLLLTSQNTPRRAFKLAWTFGFAHFASGLYWTYISTHIYGGAPAWLGLLLSVTLYAYLALYVGIAGYLSAHFYQRSPKLWLVAAPAAWLFTELLRGAWWTGLPWLSTGYIALDTPFACLAPIMGLHGLSFVLLLMAAAISLLALSKARSWPAWGALLTIAIALLACPSALSWTNTSGAPLSTAIIQGQGEIRMNEKWRPENQQLLIDRFNEMTLANSDAQLIVWPEGPLPATYNQLKPFFIGLDQQLKQSGSALFAGTLIRSDDDRNVFNSIVLQGAASGRYDKRHLVPFGEFFPIPAWLRPIMDVLGTPYSDFAFGNPQQDLLSAQGEKIFPNICFEDVFPDEFRRRAQGASVLLNLTNDSWFGAAVAPFQHLQIARMRALENGRWFIRATNSGISALIGPDGNIAVASTKPAYSVDVVRGKVTPRSGSTLYARYGDLALWIMSALILLFGLIRIRPQKPVTQQA